MVCLFQYLYNILYKKYVSPFFRIKSKIIVYKIYRLYKYIQTKTTANVHENNKKKNCCNSISQTQCVCVCSK